MTEHSHTGIHQPGDIIDGKYRVTGVLGKGGVAVTYRAIALATEDSVAVKVISLKQLGDWKQIELFQREAEVLAKLDHPAIPKYIDYFDLETATDKAFYIVQQQAPRKSLAQLVESGWRTSEAEVKNIARQVLEILAYLHSLDPPVVHRDIKPHNLIRSDDGKIYLVDFGAVQHTYYNTLMQGSTVVGTYGYMSPEQFRGKALPATDLYSLGATLLYLLTHRSPAELPQDTLKLNFRNSVNISESFADWLDKILEPDLEDRFGDANVALTELFISRRKKQKKLITVVGITVLAAGLILGVNSHKWFFLGRLGFYPNNMSSNEVSHRFFQQGGNINDLNKAGLTSLFFCIIWDKNENIEIVEHLLLNNNYLVRVVDVSTPVRIDRTALHIAVMENKYETAKLLIEYGADVNAPDISEKTPLFYAISNMSSNKYGAYFARKKRKNDLEIIKLLIDRGADINYKNHSLLDYALRYDLTDAAQILIDRGADVNARQINGRTPIFGNHNLNIVEILIANGAEVNIKDDYGQTPLHFVRDKDTARILIDNGAEVNSKDNRGKTPLFHKKNIELVKLLIAHGADINIKNNQGQSPLSIAIVSNNRDVAQLLISSGADIHDLNPEKIKQLHHLSEQQYLKVKQFLQENNFK
ncbi:ankyrin repeat domain-containing protein [Pleurocapsales cyanobacterium LEGE 10410]|nr:ankyrin repeat domain-containing protein [Pleurocapsales cyanobacterium LEGE 10410]